MTVKNLSTLPFDLLMDCFLLAFENYFVKMPTDKSYYQKRWKSAGVDFRFSYGMFEGEKLLGFIIHAVANRNGERIAFNTGTGVLPDYRGQKIVKQIYAQALPDLKNNGFTKSSLEVICKNKIAIKSYESIGFQIWKNYLCFAGELHLEKNIDISIIKTNYKAIDWDNIPNQKYYSWDNQRETLLQSDYSYYNVFQKQDLIGFFVIDPRTGFVAQLEVLTPSKNAWEHLFMGIQEINNTIKINNVDDRLSEKISYLKASTLKNTVNQYEMGLPL